MSRTLSVVIGSVALALVAGCSLSGQPNPRDRPVAADRELRFDVLFRENCAGCHGADGERGPAPPLHDPLFRALVPEEAVRQVIREGRSVTPAQRTPMPAFARPMGRLTPAQIEVLVHEVKGVPYRVVEDPAEPADKIQVVADPEGVKPQWGVPGRPPEGAPPYLAPKGKTGRTSADLDDIRKMVFVPACGSCHGDEGEGFQAGRRRLKDPTFLGLISDQALRRLAITGRPDFGMPDYAHKNERPQDFKPLTPAQIDDLVALLASWR
jgi:cytochrome c oxidase cbb3-type subunit 3